MPPKSAPAATSPDAGLEAAISPIVARPPHQPASFAATELLHDSTGYQDWLLVVRSRLQAGVFRYLESGVPCALWPPSLVPLWDHYALSSLCSSVDPRLVLPGLSIFLNDSDGTPKIWQALRSRYGATSAVNLLPAVVTLFSTEELPATTDSFLQFRNSFENQLCLLTLSKVTVNSLVASHLLSRLPLSLKSWRLTFVNDQGDSTTLPSVLVIFDRLLRNICPRPVDAPTAALARLSARDTHVPRSPCPNPKCRKMHWLRDCPDTAWAASFRAHCATKNGNQPAGERKSSQPAASPAASPAAAPAVADEHLSPATYAACFLSASSPFDKGVWLLDSSANRHMANDVCLFMHLQPVKGPHIAGVAGSLPSTGSGSVELNTTSGRVTVAEVLHVPTLPCNLLSIRRLDRLGFTVSFGSNAAGTAVTTAQAIANDLYTLDLAPAPCTPHALLVSPSQVSLLTLHNRLAHLPVLLLKRIVQKGMVTGVAWDYSDKECRTFSCNACLASKVHALPFARSTSIALQRLGLIHVDLAQMPHVSFGGHHYVLVIVDNHTRKHWCILLARKSDTVIHPIEVHTGATMIRSQDQSM